MSPSPQAPSYTTGSYSGLRTGTMTCSSACHGYTLGADQPTRDATNTPKWDDPTTGQCGDCHKTTTLTAGNHSDHLTWVGASAINCQNCHSGAYDGSSLLSGHVDGHTGAADVVQGGTFNSVSVSFTYAAGTGCSNANCHGAYKIAAWGAATGCGNCHGTFDGTYVGTASPDGMASTMVANHKEGDWTNNLGGDNLTNFGNGHKPSAVAAGTDNAGYCDYCHANKQATYIVGTATKHIDGKIQINNAGGMTYTSGTGCAGSCHGAGGVYTMTASGNTLETIAGAAASGCDACHGTAGAEVNDFSYGNSTQSKISTTQFAAGGHVVYGGLTCDSCHDTTGGGTHPDTSAGLTGTNPFRLKAAFSCTTAVGGNPCHTGAGNTRGNTIPYANLTSHSSRRALARRGTPRSAPGLMRRPA